MNNQKLAKKNIWYVFISLVLFLSVYLVANSVFSADPVGIELLNIEARTVVPTTVDAIAVRIVANPAQYSIDEWYARQGFAGSPQKIKVDGYDAIRDNRTVYVAGTNLTSNTANSTLYFNIYVITYNQGATAQTTDVFGKILSNWKLNNNINDQLGTCSSPLKNCTSITDCGSPDLYEVCAPGAKASDGHRCFSDDYEDCGVATNFKCVSKRKCLSDSDCLNGALCNSPKAGLLRDVKRLQALNRINQSLTTYKNINGKYPILSGGTFLPQAVISTWPSWQNTFTSQIGVSGLIDPINKLGVCNPNANATTSLANFEESSCWNGTTKKYYKDTTSANLELPAGSYAMAYTTDANGSNYNLCANMETSYTFMSFDTKAINLQSANCRTTAPIGYTGSTNNPPKIVAMSLNGLAGQEFNGYVKAEDPEGNPMTFSIAAPNTSASKGQWKNWISTSVLSSIPVVLKPTNDAKQKKIWAQETGPVGTYPIIITVTDSNGASVSTTTNIKISAGVPIINASDAEYDLSADYNYPLNYSLSFTADNFSYLELSYNPSRAVVKNWLKQVFSLFVSPALAETLAIEARVVIQNFPGDGKIKNDMLGNVFTLDNGLMVTVNKEAEGRYRLKIYGNVKTDFYNNATDLNFNLKVYNISFDPGFTGSNLSGLSAEKAFTIKLKPNLPQLNFSCNKTVGIYQNYNCQLANLNTKNSKTTYGYEYYQESRLTSGLPKGFLGNPDTGLISGAPSNLGSYKIRVTAFNEYGFSTYKEYDLTVEDSCGKYLVKYSGGPWNVDGTLKSQGGYYRTVKIGDQCWLGDNLNAGVPAKTKAIITGNVTFLWERVLSFLLFKPFVALADVAVRNLDELTIGVCYNNNPAYCQAEGRLYTASQIMATSTKASTQGICPSGWHVPSVDEFNTLKLSVGSDEGDKLKLNGNSGFEGLLAGTVSSVGSSTDRTKSGGFWSSTIESTKNWFYLLTTGSSFTATPGDDSYRSLRCIQDAPCNYDACNTLGENCTIDENSWTPAANTKCSSFVQSNSVCEVSKMVAGTKTCSSGQSCVNGDCLNICGQPITDSRDGQSYPTVQIGQQCWTAKNMAYLPRVQPRTAGESNGLDYKVYNFSSDNVVVAKNTTHYLNYGALYSYTAALTACPSGWHLPDDLEWGKLNSFLGGNTVAGGKLKETGTVHWDAPNTGATNSSGFTALGSGKIEPISYSDGLKLGSYFWSAVNTHYFQISNASAGALLKTDLEPVSYYGGTPDAQLSVRCVKDADLVVTPPITDVIYCESDTDCLYNSYCGYGSPQFCSDGGMCDC